MRMSVHSAGGVASARGREGVLALLVGGRTLLVAAESADRGPVRHRRRQRWRQVLEVSVAVDRLAADKREHRRDILDGLAGDREIVVGENGEIRELPGFDLPLL